jgi:ATP-dependent HslUV protease ATP-binding subunit HslU
MPELQGRFPIRVELTDLTRDDFLRILTEPRHALTRQYAELLGSDGVKLTFAPDGVEALADIAFKVNQESQNIGARRLHTVLELVVQEVSFDGPDLENKEVVVDRAYVQARLADVMQKEELGKFGFASR